MRQVFIIHGGNTFSSYSDYLADLKASTLEYERLKPTSNWKLWLRQQLPTDDILAPSMPNSSNAQYEEWCVVFEKLFKFFEAENIILIGHSLGAIFLAKYISEFSLPYKVSKLILVSAPYDDETTESLGSFKLTNPPILGDYAESVHFIHAEDDFVVPITELDKYQAALPFASYHRLSTGSHFYGRTFPELLEIIKK